MTRDLYLHRTGTDRAGREIYNIHPGDDHQTCNKVLGQLRMAGPAEHYPVRPAVDWVSADEEAACSLCDDTGFYSAGDPTNPTSLTPCSCAAYHPPPKDACMVCRQVPCVCAELEETCPDTGLEPRDPRMDSDNKISDPRDRPVPHITSYACGYCKDSGYTELQCQANPLGVPCTHCDRSQMPVYGSKTPESGVKWVDSGGAPHNHVPHMIGDNCPACKTGVYTPMNPEPEIKAGPTYYCPVCCEMPCACNQIMEGQPGAVKFVNCVHCADTGFMPTPCTECEQHKSLLSNGPTIRYRKMKLDGTYGEVARGDEVAHVHADKVKGASGPGMTGLHRRGPRVTEEDIDLAVALAKDIQYHRFPHTTLTVCCLTMSNGFCVTGQSAAVSLENFDLDTGMSIALDEVKLKLWELLGFRLKQAIFDGAIKDRP